MSNWNFADVWETVAAGQPEAPALIQGQRHLSWAEFDQRADGVARALMAAGLSHQATVAQYLYSCPEYLETVFGCWKVSCVPVNTNFRYVDDELVYLWTTAHCSAVVFHGAFTERIAEVRSRVPDVRLWLWVDDGTGPCPPWAVPYETAAGVTTRVGPRIDAGRRGPDDLYLLYTGGTTGLPKGVMWRQDDLFALLNRGARIRYPEEGDLTDVRQALMAPGTARPVCLPAAPLMHGTGAFNAFSALSSGGCVVLLEGRQFSAREFLDVAQREGVTVAAIVGDASPGPS